MGVSNFISYNGLTAPASRPMGVFTPPSCTSADSMFFLDLLQSTEIPIQKYEILSVYGYEQVCTRDLKVSSGEVVGHHGNVVHSDRRVVY